MVGHIAGAPIFDSLVLFWLMSTSSTALVKRNRFLEFSRNSCPHTSDREAVEKSYHGTPLPPLGTALHA